jgi:hypothetical protein
MKKPQSCSIAFPSHKILTFLFLAAIFAGTHAQSAGDTLVNELILQFKQVPPLVQSGYNSVRTGVHALDSLNILFDCISIQRLFSDREFPGLGKSSCLARIYSLRFKQLLSAKRLISAYLQTGYFEHAETVKTGVSQSSKAVIPNDQYFSRQWAFLNNGTFSYNGVVLGKSGADMKVTEAWDIQKGDSAIIVAILDSGCRLKHDEFKGRIWPNKKEIPGNGVDDDGNGYVDDIEGWNFVDSNNVPEDDYGHGTGIATEIAANPNNGIGYAGMNWQCKIMVVKVSDSAGHTRSDLLAKGILYAANNGANVINISIAFKDTNYAVNLAIDYAYEKGIIICCGTGNDNNEGIAFPASNKKTIAVGSTDPDDTRSTLFVGNLGGGSNYGQDIDVVAPGNYIAFLWISPDDYNTIGGGTSNSTAFVSGLASLMLAQNRSLTPTQVRDIICATADDQVGNPAEDTKGWDKYYGFGRVNARKALEYVVSMGVKPGFKENHPSAPIRMTTHRNGNIYILCNKEYGLYGVNVGIFTLKGQDVTGGYAIKRVSSNEIVLTPEKRIEGVRILSVTGKEKKFIIKMAGVRR